MATIVMDFGMGFSGECTIAGYRGYLDAVALFDTLEVPVPQQGAGGGGRTVGRARMSDIEVVRYVDSASPSLASACSGARMIPEIHLLLFRMLEGQMVNHMDFKLWNSYITRLERDSEDAAGAVYGPHINDSGDLLQSRPNAGAGAALAQRSRNVTDRPASRPAVPSSGASISQVEVERLWIRPAAAAWAYRQYDQGTLLGATSTGWDFEQGVDIGASDVMKQAPTRKV